MNNSLQLILLLVWKMDENNKNITPLLYKGLAWIFFSFTVVELLQFLK